MVREHRIGHPGHAVDGHDGDHTGIEDARLIDLLGVAEHHHEDAGEKHEHLNDEGHREALLTDHRAKFRHGTHDGHNGHRGEEDPEGSPLLAGELHAEERGVFTVNVLLLFGISNQSLELFILVEILAAEHRERAHEEETDDGGRDHHGEQLHEAEGTTTHLITVHQGDQGHGSHGSRRADHTHLSSDRGSSHRAFRTNVVADGNVINNREHRVNHVTRTAENREEPADVRSEVAHGARVLTKHFFCDLQQAVQTARSLQSGARADHGHNRENHVNRRFPGLQAEAEAENHQTDTAHQAQRHAALRSSIEQAGQKDGELQPEI